MAVYKRTKYEANLDIDYAIELHFRHVQLYKHLSGMFTFLTLLGGSTIAISASQFDPIIPAIIGGAVVLISLLDVTIKPATQAAHHADIKRRWANLLAGSIDMDLEKIDKQIAQLRETDTHVIRALEMPSYNANLKRHGRPESIQKTGCLEKIFGLIS